MKGQDLPDEHHVIRVVPYGKLEKDDNGDPTGRLLFSAFQRREIDKGLSVTWLEYFGGDRPEKVVRAVQAIRASKFTPGGKSAFAIGEVGGVKRACTASGHNVRIVHEPTDDNRAHAEVLHLPADNRVLLEALATTVWAEVVFNADVPAGAAPAPDEPAPGAT